MINKFDGMYGFLSNFYIADVTYNGITYTNNEAAFQSMKTTNLLERKSFANLTPAVAKAKGKHITLRKDWESVKDDIMFEICLAKFQQHEDLKTKLLNTRNVELIEGNTWNDTYWGVCNGFGENRLGKILMRVREELREQNKIDRNTDIKRLNVPFNVKNVTEGLIEWIKDTFEENGKNCNAIVGISGGVDSSVVASLCVKALGKNRVIGVLMPNGTQSDFDDAMTLVDYLGIDRTIIDIAPAYRTIISKIPIIESPNNNPVLLKTSDQTKINLPPRLRMSILYAFSQSVNGRVMNTCNLSEDYVGWNTRWGDAAGDFSPLANLTKTEVFQIAKYLGLPDKLSHKTPIDGLCGKSDEEKFGFTYKILDRYIRTGECDDLEIKKKIDEMHKKNLFKLQPMPCFDAI